MKDYLSKFSLYQKLNIGFWITAVLLLAFAFFSLYNIKVLIDNAKAVDHTNYVIQKLENIISYVKDAETGERGFVISKDEKFLEPYFDSYEKVNREFEAVKKLTADNPNQQLRLNTLRALIDITFKKIQYAINGQRRGLDISSIWSTKPEVDHIRSIIITMQAEENSLLKSRLDEFSFSTYNAPGIIFLFSLIAFGIAYAAFRIIKANAIRITEDTEKLRLGEISLSEAYKEVQLINEELQSTNEELVSTNKELYSGKEELSALNEELRQSEEELFATIEELRNSLDRIELFKKELEASQKRFIEAEAIANIGNWEWDMVQNKIYWSDQLKKIFGFDPSGTATFDYETYISLVHHEDAVHVKSLIEKSLNDLTPYTVEHRIKWKDGSLRWVLSKGEPITEDGKLVKLAGTALDITELRIAEVERRTVEIQLQSTNEELYATVEELKQAEERLVESNNLLEKRVLERTKEFILSQERFRLVSLATNDVIWDWDLNTNEIWWNEAFKKIFGYNNEPNIFAFQHKIDKIHPEDRDEILSEIKNAIDNNFNYWSGEYRFLTANGDYLHVLDRGYILYDERSHPYRMLGSLLDISYRKKLEEEKARLYADAEQQRSELYNILMQAPAGIAILKGPAHTYEMANELYYKITGKSNDIIGKPGREAMPELISQGVWDIIDNVYQSGDRYIGREFPVEVDRLSGNEKLDLAYFDFVIEAIKDFNKKIIAVLIHAIEVTDQVRSRKLVEESAFRFKQLLENIPQITWTNSPHGEVDFYNQRWYDYTGMNFEQSKKWGWQPVIHPDDLPQNMEKFLKALNTGEAFISENRLKRAIDGEYRWHLSIAMPLRDEEGNITLWLGTSTDIHEQKTSEEILSKKNKELSQINNDLDNFIYTASHDLKAPISNIEGLIILLTGELNKASEKNLFIDQLLDMVNQSITRFKGTILDLTEITKVQRGVGEEKQIINILEIINDVEMDIMNMIIESKAQISIEINDKHEINFSRKNFKSIIYNLLSNAIKYRSPDQIAEILIKAEKVQDYTLLTVKDNGLGMDLSKGAIFTMFKRLHDHVEGTGIGLYLVKRIIDNAGGKIEVESKVNVGSTFRVYIKN